eukprot:2780798-Rhodomonas_salina.1
MLPQLARHSWATLPKRPRLRYNDYEQCYERYVKEVERTVMVELYYEHAGGIDRHNSERQSVLCVERNLLFNVEPVPGPAADVQR